LFVVTSAHLKSHGETDVRKAQPQPDHICFA
jgi:hypothetical protein